MPCNTVNPASAPTDHSGPSDKAYIDGMKFRVFSGVVTSPILITKFLSSSGL